MADTSSNDTEAEQFGKLWKLLTTPVGDLAGSNSDRNTESGIEPGLLEKIDRYGGFKRKISEKKHKAGRANITRERGFSKRHSSAPSEELSGRKQHNFRETTKRIGFNAEPESSPIGLSDTRNKGDGKSLYKPGFFTLFFGVFLPVMAMVFETSTHFLAKNAFDPFPTTAHLFLFSLIPISNFLNWLAVRRNIAPLYSVISLATGMALGISILYSVMLLPLTEQFLQMIPAGGIGLLGLAPLTSIPVTLMCGTTICQLAERQKTFFDSHQLKHLGHLIILVMVLSVELPSTLTRVHLSKAAHGDQDAIKWLRQWGNQDVLLRACYERSGEATDILGTMAEHNDPVGVDSARNIFYRVTGVSFNSVPIPNSFRGTIKHAGLIDDPANLNDSVKDEFDLDPDIAGELVSGVARGLSVSDSSIAGTLNPAGGIASLDWNFTFENVSTIPREARAKILLPPNAVVTKATLWLDDWQRETVIQERDLARSTYVNSITSQKRDPLLVSMSGKDSVLVQCYPVVKGTKTRIRLHIVSPLVLSSKTEESLVLPTFEERNFAITIPHKIDLHSATKISLNGTDSKTNGRDHELKANLQNSLMSRFEAVARVNRTNGLDAAPLMVRPPESKIELRQAFYSMLPDSALANIPAKLQPTTGKSPNLSIVVDKSITMSPYIQEIAKGLQDAPKTLPITLIEVKDWDRTFCIDTHSDNPKYQAALKAFAESKCEGGQSDALLLEEMFTVTTSARSIIPDNSDVLWIHAAQPVSSIPVNGMLNSLRSNESTRPRLFDLQVCSGPNAILTESYAYPKLERLVRTGALSQDIATFIQNYANNKVRRAATTFSAPSSGTDAATNLEVSQVQAYRLAMARYHAGDSFGAYDLASRYHLVTPVSSAVVTDDAPIVVDELAGKNNFNISGSDETEAAPPPFETSIAEPAPDSAMPPEYKTSARKEKSQHLPQRKLEISNERTAMREGQMIAPGAPVNQPKSPTGSPDTPISEPRSNGFAAAKKGAESISINSFKQNFNPQATVDTEEFQARTDTSSSAQRDSAGFTSSLNQASDAESTFYRDAGSSKAGGGGSRQAAGISYGDAFSGSSANIGDKIYSSANSNFANSGAPTSILQGATNGTLGPQQSNGNIMGVQESDASRFEQTFEQRRQKLDYKSADAGFNPFSGVVSKLNSLSSAASSSEASGCYSVPGDSNPGLGQMEGVSTTSNGIDPLLNTNANHSSSNRLESPIFMFALLATGAAFLGMLVFLFRLIGNGTGKDNELNMKP